MADVLERRERRAALGFISPWIIGFLVFTLGPMVASLVLSFTDYSLVGDVQGVGTANYEALVSDPKVARSLTNTFVYALLYVPGATDMVYLFQNAFQFFRMGFASAMAWVLFAIILVVTVVQIRVGNRFVYYEGSR